MEGVFRKKTQRISPRMLWWEKKKANDRLGKKKKKKKGKKKKGWEGVGFNFLIVDARAVSDNISYNYELKTEAAANDISSSSSA